MQVWEGDQVCFVVCRYRVDCMTDLLNVDGRCERSLLGVVSFEVDSMFLIGYAVRSGRRMMAAKNASASCRIVTT